MVQRLVAAARFTLNHDMSTVVKKLVCVPQNTSGGDRIHSQQGDTDVGLVVIPKKSILVISLKHVEKKKICSDANLVPDLKLVIPYLKNIIQFNFQFVDQVSSGLTFHPAVVDPNNAMNLN